jgi:hypothetical protein
MTDDPQALDEYCCEEHYPSMADTPEQQMEHFCPVCGWTLSEVLSG